MHPVIIIIVVVMMMMMMIIIIIVVMMVMMMMMMMMMIIIIIIIITITYLRPHGSKTHSGYKSENVYLSYRRSLIGQDRMSVVLQGGSWVSTGEVSSVFTRSWFRRHFFQQAGFRLVRSVYNESDGRVLHLPIRLINTPIFMLGTGVEGMTIKLIISLKPGTHGNKVEFNTVDFVENRLLPKPATNRQQSRLLPYTIRSTLLLVLATNRQQLEFDSLSRSTSLSIRSTLLPIRSTLSPVCTGLNRRVPYIIYYVDC